ncbi:hypothetical protein [Alicyclobacillus sp. SP_1]|uniref:beta strand repeat-containing protein n=1 Tax=Alicyclobacillus sp. SP_1 TaxID=2942475 RepID=UPI00215773D2|nr:hypothetical protein [Alicyclobacillus sp. SP_1]
MKRVLTGIAAAGVVLGMTVPTAFAATNSSMNMKAMTWKQDQIMLGTSSIGFKGFESMYAGTETTYMPIYYLNEYLHKMGFGASWDGVNKVWSITTPTGVTVDTSAFGTAGQGTAGIYVNGTLVQMTTPKFAKDPASHVETTYMPIYFLLKVLQGIGVAQQSDWNGNTGVLTLVKPAVTTPTTTALSAISINNQSSGTGSVSNPAVVLNGGSATLSTTLTDAMGNPIPNTQVTFAFSQGNMAATGLTVESNGNVLAPQAVGQGATATDYDVYTNSNGQATVTVSGPSGQTAAYSVTASAPYQTSSGVSLTTSAVNVEFVAPGSVGITPYASNGEYEASFGTAVPVTVTLPPVNGTAQSNVELTFTATSKGGGNPYFTNTSGANMGSVATAFTNSAGQATVWLNDSVVGADDTVTVTGTTPTMNINESTMIQFVQAGTPANIENLSVTNSNPTAGQNVTISGTLVDASGNPVPNAQVLLVGGYNSNNGTFGYVSGTTTTDFPDVTIAEGVPANSTYGDVLTTNSAGVFTATVTDTSAEVDGYALYPVQNGVVSSNTPLNYSSTVSTTVNNADEAGKFTGELDFAAATALSNITAFGIEPTSVTSSDGTTVTGIDQQAGNIATAYFAPVSASAAITDQTMSYNLSVSNGGTINQIDGVNLLNAVSATTLNVTYYSSDSGDYYLLTVPGGFTVGQANYTALQVNVTGNPSLTSGAYFVSPLLTGTELFSVGVSNTATGNTVLSVTSGSAKASATFGFSAGAVDELANVTPVSAQISTGQTGTFQFTVEDASGNPIPDTSVQVDLTSTAQPLWITQVNGQTLEQSESITGGVATEPTPIPLYTPTAWSSKAPYSDVVIPGVVNASSVGMGTSTSFYIYTNTNGQATLTVQNGNVPYYDGSYAGDIGTSSAASTGGTLQLGLNGTTIQLGTSGVASAQGEISFPGVAQTVSAGSGLTLSTAVPSGQTAWLAPANTSTFTAGPTETSAVAGSTSITAPTKAGTYYLYMVNSSGTVLSTSTYTVTVTAGAPAKATGLTYASSNVTVPTSGSTNDAVTTQPTVTDAYGNPVTADGTYSISTTTGVSINASTGELTITSSASTTGSVVVTYTQGSATEEVTISLS